MIDELHHSVWFTYRRAIGSDASWNPGSAFQAALDLYLRLRPGSDAASACREAARMIMTRPRGVANRGRIVSGAGVHVPSAADGATAGHLIAAASFAPFPETQAA